MLFAFAVITTVFIAGLISLFILGSQWYRFLKLTVRIDGPSLWTLVRKLPSVTYDTLVFSYSLCQSYSFKIFRVYLLDLNAIFVVSDPDDFSEVIKHKDLSDKPYLHYGVLGHFLGGETLLSINGEPWKRHRRALTPAFRKGVLESYIPLLRSEASKFVSDLREIQPGTSIDISQLMRGPSLSTSCKVTLRSDENIDGLAAIADHISDLFAFTHVKSVNPVFFHLYERFRTCYRKCMNCVASASSQFHKSALKVKDHVERELKTENSEFSPSSALEHILSEKNSGHVPLTDEEIDAEMLLLAVAGSVTTLSSNVLVLALMALNPDVQRKVIDELSSIFGDSDRPVSAADLRRMEYLDRVIKETLRMFPAVPMMSRHAKEEVNIRGTLIPKGSVIGVIIMALHRNPKYFEKPNEFDPDRFLPGYTEKIPEHAYIPFGGGERVCIGQRYAMLYMKVFLSTFFRSFEVRPGEGFRSMDDIKLKGHVTLHFPEGVPLRLYPLCR